MIYSVRRFSDDEKKGMGTGTKLLLGAGALAGAFAGAKSGMFGTGLQRGANRLWAKGGKLIGSDKMVNSGNSGVIKANAKDIGNTINKAPKVTPKAPVSDEAKKKAQENIINSIPNSQPKVPLANAGSVAAENTKKSQDFWMSGLNI